MIPSEPSERHRAIAATFAGVVACVSDWDASTPVAQWRASDVVDHLLEWPVGFFAAGGIELAPAHGDPVTRVVSKGRIPDAVLDRTLAAYGVPTGRWSEIDAAWSARAASDPVLADRLASL